MCRFSGIFDTVEIRALGYPFTPLFAEFNADYDIVLTELGKGPASGEPKEKVQAVIDLVKDHPKTKILDLPDDAVKNAKLRVLYRGSWCVFFFALHALLRTSFDMAYRNALTSRASRIMYAWPEVSRCTTDSMFVTRRMRLSLLTELDSFCHFARAIQAPRVRDVAPGRPAPQRCP